MDVNVSTETTTRIVEVEESIVKLTLTLRDCAIIRALMLSCDGFDRDLLNENGDPISNANEHAAYAYSEHGVTLKMVNDINNDLYGAVCRAMGDRGYTECVRGEL